MCDFIFKYMCMLASVDIFQCQLKKLIELELSRFSIQKLTKKHQKGKTKTDA